MYALHIWRMCAPYLEKLGPPRWRRILANLAIVVTRDSNLSRMRDIVHTMHSSSLGIFRDKRHTVIDGGLVVSDLGEGNDILSTLSTLHSIHDGRSALNV